MLCDQIRSSRTQAEPTITSLLSLLMFFYGISSVCILLCERVVPPIRLQDLNYYTVPAIELLFSPSSLMPDKVLDKSNSAYRKC